MRVKKSTIKFIISLVVIIAVVLIGYYSLPLLFDIFGYLFKLFLPFVLGYVFSLVTKPLVKFLQKWLKLPKGIAAVLVMILILGILGGIVGFVVYKIVDEIKELYLKISENYDQIELFMKNFGDQTRSALSRLHPSIQDAVAGLSDDFMHKLGSLIDTSSQPVMDYAGNFAKALPSIFIGTIVFLLSTFFMLSDFDFISGTIKKVFKGSALEKFERVKIELKNYLGGYLKAQLIIMSIAFFIMLVSFWLMGVDYGFIIAFGIALLDALPFFGSGAVLWPWSIISFMNGDIERGFGLIIVYVIIVITRQLVEPKIVSSKVGMHPLLTLMAMYVGYKTLSIGGMILGPIILMVCISFYRAGVFDSVVAFISGVLQFLKNEFIIIKNYVKDLGEDE